MPWLNWSDAIKKRICRYLLQRYLGQFLQEKLTLDQLSVDLYNGKGRISDVCLDVKGLNELGEKFNLPIRFVEGFILSIEVAIPWTKPLTDNSVVEIDGLMMTVQPKQRVDDASMFEPMWGSMMSSMQLAEEYLRQEPLDKEDARAPAEPLAGLEQFAQAIETVFSRIKVKLTNTVIRVEHFPCPSSQQGVALELHIKSMDYYDQVSTEAGDIAGETIAQRVHERISLSTKRIILNGSSLYAEEFSLAKESSSGLLPRSTAGNDGPQELLAGCAGASPPLVAPSQESSAPEPEMEPILISQLMGQQEIRLQLKQDESLEGPNVDVDFSLGQLPLFLCPRQVHLLIQLAKGFSCPTPASEDLSGSLLSRRYKCKPMDSHHFAIAEQDLQRQMINLRAPPPPSRSLGGGPNAAGWSTYSAAGCFSDSDEEYAPMTRQGAFSESGSVASSDMDSSMSSSTFNSFSKPKKKSKVSRRSSQGGGGGFSEDALLELTHFRVHCSAVYAVVLHDDVAGVANSNRRRFPAAASCPSPKEAGMMHAQAETFFRALAGQNLRDLGAMRNLLPKICRSDHIRIAGAPVTLEGTEKSSPSQWSLSFQLSVVEMEVIECVFDHRSDPEDECASLRDAEFCELLSFFERDGKKKRPSEAEPFLRLKCEHVEKTSQGRVREPCTTVVVEMLPAQIEVDRSLEDRIHALLHPPPHLSSAVQKDNDIWSLSVDQGNRCGSLSSSKTSIRVHSSFVKVNLRFPVPDMRPVQELLRERWWEKNLRTNILSVDLSEPTLSTTFTNDRDADLKLVLVCKDAHVFHQESPLSRPVLFARVFVDPKVKEADFDWLRMEVRISASSQPSPLETVGGCCGEEDTLLPSMMDTLLVLPAVEAQDPGSPFAVQHVMYDGNKVSPPRTSRLQEQQQQRGGGGHDSSSRTDSSEMIQPGDKASLRSFMEKTANNCRIHLDFSLPSVELTMPDKQFYEVIYNLLTMDLVLWEPVATRVAGSTDVSAMSASGGGVAFFADLAAHRGQQEFVMCRSGLPADSDEESDGAPSVFYSVYDHQRSSTRHGRSLHQFDGAATTATSTACRSLQTQLVIGVHIADGVARMGTPLRDAGGELLPRQQGELRVCAKDAQLFISSSHRGDPNLSYVLFSAGTASLHHRGKAGSSTPLPVLYKSADGVAARLSPFAACEAEPADMLSLVIETCADPTQGVKTIKVAVGVSGTTLRHRMSPFRHSWVKQFIDFFDVVDEEVRGYTPLGVVTELHLSLTNCAIDYRPLYIPYRSLVSMENFSISSNITAKTTTLQIRVIAEQVCLYISNKVARDEPPDLANEYVCVADTDLFDLSVWMTEVAGQETPTIKMKASNNIVHVRTCADSCQALQTLLSYFATDGDLVGSPGTPPPGTESAGGVVPEQLNSVTIRMSDHYQSLMAEAMRESSSSTSGSHSPNTDDDSPPSFVRADHEDEDDDDNSDGGFRDARGDNVFACNGDDFSVRREMELQCATENDEPVADGGSLLLRMSTASSSQSLAGSRGTPARESDEEFCILEDDPGVGIVPRSGQPQIRVLVPGPIDVRENYFSSSARNTDQLRAPRHFPEALQKYTLREMSLVWHLYGGCDFEGTATPASGTSKSPPERHPTHWNVDEQHENFANVILEPMAGNVTFSRGSPGAGDSPLPCRQPQSPPATPRHGSGGKAFAGGPGRRDDVLMELHMNKIRFQHELYPEGALQASRQVLLIQDVEIRDRLASSRINKFLYQYTSETMPRESHANMVMIKLLHIRPDPKLPSQECCMRVTLKPLRLNIDQDALLFLYEFFTSVSSSSPASPSSPPADFPEFARSNAADDPVGTSNNPALSGSSGGRHVVFAGDNEGPVSPPPGSSSSSGGPPPLYIRTFAFTSDVPIRIDYHGKRVAMDQGALAGLLMGLGQLNCLEITLKRLYCRQGLLGCEKLVAFVLNEWLNDIKKNQVPSVLGGVGPMHSFVQLFSGLRDLVWLPVEQYRRDGRIVRGLQRGANSFTVSTAMACLELTNKLVQTVQGVAELAYDMLSPGPSLRVEVQRGHHRALPSTQPLDIREGVNNAYHVVAEGLGGTARTLVQAASQEHRQKGVSGAVGGLLRHLGPTMAAGIIVATEATSSVLGGVRNQIRPDARREAVQKWRQPTKTGPAASAAAALAAASR